jgi:hypothetical protein
MHQVMNIMMQQLGRLFLVRCWIFGIKPQQPSKRAAKNIGEESPPARLWQKGQQSIS